jgi:predicted nucleic acid-binding protein
MKLLIDTNVILDALMEREPWAESAQALLLAIAEEKAEGFITASTVTDIYYILKKQLGDKEKVKQALLGLFASVSVLDVNGTDCEKAFELALPDYEDALLAYCGMRHKVDFIVTRNSKHFKESPVKAVTPDEMYDTVKDK